MTDSIELATTPKTTKSRNSNSSVQIQMKPKSQSEFVPRDIEESEFLDLVDFGDIAFIVETVIYTCMLCPFGYLFGSFDVVDCQVCTCVY